MNEDDVVDRGVEVFRDALTGDTRVKLPDGSVLVNPLGEPWALSAEQVGVLKALAEGFGWDVSSPASPAVEDPSTKEPSTYEVKITHGPEWASSSGAGDSSGWGGAPFTPFLPVREWSVPSIPSASLSETLRLGGVKAIEVGGRMLTLEELSEYLTDLARRVEALEVATRKPSDREDQHRECSPVEREWLAEVAERCFSVGNHRVVRTILFPTENVEVTVEDFMDPKHPKVCHRRVFERPEVEGSRVVSGGGVVEASSEPTVGDHRDPFEELRARVLLEKGGRG